MGEVIQFPESAGLGRSSRVSEVSSEPATIIILPVIRIDRGPDDVEPDAGNSSGRRRRRRIAR